jgi:DNA repair protein RecO (recombination protein O)
MSQTTRVTLEPAWILHQYPYRDSSLLLEVFSRTHGRIGLVARGARAARSRLQGTLQILQPLALSWTLRGELGTLTGAETRSHGLHLQGRQVLCASYLNELLLRLVTRQDPHPEVFEAYETALATLAGNEQQALRVFEKRLLQGLGYGLLLDREFGSGAPVQDDLLYEYQLERGPERCRQPAVDGLCLRGASLLSLHRGELHDRCAPARC